MKIKSENYENIKACLKEIIEIIENFKTITIDGKEFKIDSYAGGDLKWLAIVFGINAANSKCSCPLCKWNSKLALAFDAVWPLDRSQEEAAECIKKKKKKDKDIKIKQSLCLFR